MQRDGGNEVAILDQPAARTSHPAGEGRRRIDAVRMLEAQDQLAAAFLIAQRGAGTAERRARIHAGPAQGTAADLMLEWVPATGADRAFEKGETAPAGGAKRGWICNLLPAAEAARRQERIEQEAAGAGGRQGERVHARAFCSRAQPGCQPPRADAMLAPHE